MDLNKRIKSFEKLQEQMQKWATDAVSIEVILKNAHARNNWFTHKNIRLALSSFAESISKNNIDKWLSKYDQAKLEQENNKRIGVIMAGNIPLVGFNDMLCVLISGNILIAKLSSNDKILPLFILDTLKKIEPLFEKQIEICEGQFKNIDAIIATGSTNSSRYFEYYFGKYPHIIRKNRHSAAVLTGKETHQELIKLGEDIFNYFGLGCRNISKIFVPKGYDLDNVFKAVYEYRTLLENNKYSNNYEYNKTVYLLSKIPLLENGFLLMKEDIGLSSPVAVLYYEYYKNETALKDRLHMDSANVQCIVSNKNFTGNDIQFGETQCPQLWNYSDNVDTLKFLLEL